MSATLNGWQTRICWDLETNIGTAVTPALLWASNEKDSLNFNDKIIDMKEMFTGVRGPISTQIRAGNYEIGGDLGAAPMYLDGSSTAALKMALAFYQTYARGTLNAAGADYTYTFTPVTTQPETWRGLTVLKDTGMGSGKCPKFAGCVVDTLEFSWDFGGAILWKPTLIGLSGTQDGTAPAATAAPTQGFMQAPNMTVTWNGATIHPVGWNIKLHNNITGVPGPGQDGFRTYSSGGLSGEITLKTWRDVDFYGSFIAPYLTEGIGTLVITATADTAYGTMSCGSAYTATWTTYGRFEERGDLPMIRGQMVDTVNLAVVFDNQPSLVLYSDRTSDL